MIVLDFETKKIEDGGPLLPLPVGCAILDPERYPEGHYFAWGHPEGNNCTKEEFGEYLKSIWGKEILTQNGSTFDIPIAQHHFGLPPRDPLLTHDTLFASFLHDPHARSLSLKDLANDWLGIPPDEQQTMYDWIMENVPDCTSRKQCGAYISETPVELSGPYAVGDCTRTDALWSHVKPLIESMREPYDRERKLAPILADIQNRGVRCDLERLKADYHESMLRKHKLDQMIRDHLEAGPEFNPGSDKELGAVLLARGYSGFLTTPTGKLSMNKASLDTVLQADPELRSMLKSRSLYDTLTGTFMGPWIRYAEANGGRIHAGYNQVRNPEGFGTRTGRLSSSKPNFQNVVKNLGNDHFGLPFPEMRSYLLPEEGHVWLCADFKNQEPRIAAHFEGEDFMQAFTDNPMMDPYKDYIMNLVQVTRPEAKTILLGLLYSMGAASLAEQLGCEPAYATALRNMVKAALDGIVRLDNDCKRRWMQNLPIRTLGGRLYHCEPPSNGRRWEYKALNTLVQGSAADQTKEALIYVNERLPAGCRILGTVHDEISVSCPESVVPLVTALLQEAANALPCDVPMVMSCEWGPSWAEAK